MMKLMVNNQRKTLQVRCSILDALAQWGYQPHTIAVAINGEFVPRSTYAQHVLADGDQVDIVAPIQGG